MLVYVSKRQEIHGVIVCLQVKSDAVYATVHFGSKTNKAEVDKTNDSKLNAAWEVNAKQ
jgi:hypothetical protein